MKIGLIDAEILVNRKKRFPNLAIMKLSSFFKSQGHDTQLILNYDDLYLYDQIYLSCVFSKTRSLLHEPLLQKHRVICGGTGFYYDKYDDAPHLTQDQEHAMPDYSIYDEWIKYRLSDEEKEENLKYFTDFSIGFLTRGCFRKCSFCVNRNSKRSALHSPVSEFLADDGKRNLLSMLDDNVLALGQHDLPSLMRLLNELIQITTDRKSRFEFKQGMDLRLMNQEYAKLFAQARYNGDFIFAFDNLKEQKQIEKGLTIFRNEVQKDSIKAYVFCGFPEPVLDDIVSAFQRIKILWKYHALAYIMRHDKYLQAKPPYKNIYVQLGRWCNQPRFQKKMTFRVFCNKSGGIASDNMRQFQDLHPSVSDKFFDIAYPGSPYAGPSPLVDEWSQKDFTGEVDESFARIHGDITF